MADLNKLVEELSVLTVLEAAELTKLLEVKWGVSAAAPVAMAAMPGVAAVAAAPVEEKTEFTVVLKEAKDLAETPNAKVLDLVAKDAAEEAKKKLTEVGATVEVK